MVLEGAEDFDVSAVVAAGPLPVDGSLGVDGESQGGGRLAAAVVGGSGPGLFAGILQPDDESAGGQYQRIADEGRISDTEELVFPGGVAFEPDPVLAAEAIVGEFEDLADEVPGPNDGAVWLEGMHARAEGCEVDPIVAHHGRGEDRFAAVDHVDGPAIGGVEDVVGPGHCAEVEIVFGNGGRGDIVAVGLAARGGEFPDDVEGVGVKAPGDSGSVDHEDAAAGDDGRGEETVGAGGGGEESERFGQASVGYIAGVPGVELELGPVFGRPDRRKHRY